MLSPAPPCPLTSPKQQPHRGRIGIVLCAPRPRLRKGNSRIPASGGPRRFPLLRLRARCPASSPDPAPKQQQPPTRGSPSPPHNSRRLLFEEMGVRGLPGHAHGVSWSRAQHLVVTPQERGVTKPAVMERRERNGRNGGRFEIFLRKSMTRPMVRTWTESIYHPVRQPPALDAGDPAS